MSDPSSIQMGNFTRVAERQSVSDRTEQKKITSDYFKNDDLNFNYGW